MKVFSSQVGVKEQGGSNRGPKVKVYLASSGNHEGQPWCAAFVNWCFRQVGLHGPAGAGAARNWFPAARVIYRRGAAAKKKPQPGDCAGFYYAHLGRIGHIGFIERWEENFAITVEGNTGGGSGINRNGDGVYRMRRLRSQISIVSTWIPKS
ncbi:CHAP domain-containing protein [Hymenobacter sp. B81]|uniref:CHAP domain-containing protein n=1 Tax=Hymenobacter sp. B81 TaxID=3344878 RepID=UPI0037DD600A